MHAVRAVHVVGSLGPRLGLGVRAPPMPPTPGRAGGLGAEFNVFVFVGGGWGDVLYFCAKTIF